MSVTGAAHFFSQKGEEEPLVGLVGGASGVFLCLVTHFLWSGVVGKRRNKEADEGVGRGPGGPPYSDYMCAGADHGCRGDASSWDCS
jgi:hypothetical protein